MFPCQCVFDVSIFHMFSKSWIKVANSCRFTTQMGGNYFWRTVFFLQVLDTENLTFATFKSNHKLREAKWKASNSNFPGSELLSTSELLISTKHPFGAR